MKHRLFLPIPACMLVIVMMAFIGFTNTASAQQNLECCVYRVDIDNVPGDCFPFTLYTYWGCPGSPTFALAQTFTTNGVSTHPVGNPAAVPCPKSCKLERISLNGITFIYPGQEQQVIINNCCYRVFFAFDDNKCIYIRIRRCG